MATRRCIVCNGPIPEPAYTSRKMCSDRCAKIRRNERERAYHVRRKCTEKPRPPGPAPGSTPAPCERDEAMLLHRQARALLAPLDRLVLAQRPGERMQGFFR